MEKRASSVSLIPAFSGAFQAEHEKHPVFADSVARKLISDDEYAGMRQFILAGLDFFASDEKRNLKSEDEAIRHILNTHLAPTPLCGAAYCERALSRAVRMETCQYVILGAGLDTFAFRNPDFMCKYCVFEIDHPKTQADKLGRIARAGLTAPENLHFVVVDFMTGNLKEKLLSAGFDTKKKTFFSWLGVSYYLCHADIEKLISDIAEISAEGSTLLFDYADAGLLLAEEKRVRNMIAMAKAGGRELCSGFDYPAMDAMLGERGFLVYEVMTPSEIQRDIIDTAGADMKAFEHINYIQAVIRK